MNRYLRRGFTLIELLTVIAIIAVLAAILLPVYFRSKEGVRQAGCISNLHDIFVAANTYKQDYGAFPPLLLGYAEQQNGLPWMSGGTPPVPVDQVKHGYLYPRYVKNIESFHCPDDPDDDKSKVKQSIFAPPGVSPTVASFDVQDVKGYSFQSLPQSFANQPIPFYAYDSYDVTAYMDANGKRLAGQDGTPGFQCVYAKDWTGVIGPQDAPYQLKYPNPPPDRTVLAWCNYHVTTAQATKCVVMFTSGTAKTIDFKQMVQKGFAISGP